MSNTQVAIDAVKKLYEVTEQRNECCSIISQLNELIVARTNTQSSPNLDPRKWGRIDSEGNFGAGK